MIKTSIKIISEDELTGMRQERLASLTELKMARIGTTEYLDLLITRNEEALRLAVGHKDPNQPDLFEEEK